MSSDTTSLTMTPKMASCDLATHSMNSFNRAGASLKLKRHLWSSG